MDATCSTTRRSGLDEAGHPTPSPGTGAELVVTALTHRSAPLALLGKAAVPAGDVGEVLDRLRELPGVDEAMVLATCNRVELYTVSTGGPDVQYPAPAVIEMIARRAGAPIREVARHALVRRGEAAVRHLMEVTAGLDSMVVGDEQIIGQVRAAYRTTVARDAAGPVLHRLAQRALRAGKEVRSTTTLARTGSSVITRALQLAAQQVPDQSMAGRRAVVIGAGATGALAVAHLLRQGAASVAVVGRTPSRADHLAATANTGAVTAHPPEDLVDLLANADVLVGCASSPTPVVTTHQLQLALTHRAPGTGPLVVCDLGLPRNIGPLPTGENRVALVDLQSLTHDGHSVMQSLAHAAARAVVDAHVAGLSTRPTCRT